MKYLIYLLLTAGIFIGVTITNLEAAPKGDFTVLKVSQQFVVGITEHNRDNLYAVLYATEGSYIVYNNEKLKAAMKLNKKSGKSNDYYLPIHLYLMKNSKLKQYPIRVYANHIHLSDDQGFVGKVNSFISNHVIDISKEFTLQSSFSYFRFNNGINFYGLDSKKTLTRRNSYIFVANDSLPYIAKSANGYELPYIDVFYCKKLHDVFRFIGPGNSKCEFGRVSYSAIYNPKYMTYLGLRKKEVKNQYQDNTLLSALSLIDIDWQKAENVSELLVDKIMVEVAQRISKRYRVIDKWGKMTLKDFATYVANAAIEFNVDPWLILSVVETESGFRPAVKSSAQAMGFMQIIPTTGWWIAKRLDMKLNGTKDIYKPAINIRMGTWYLSYLLKRFNYDKVVVATAYNAGPARAYRKYVFKETRQYKKRIVKHYNRFVKSLQSKFGAFLNSDVIVVVPHNKEKLSTSNDEVSNNRS